MPSIRIISPQADEVWSEDNLTVKVEVRNFIMDPDAIGLAKAPGRGHWHLYVDGHRVGISTEEAIALEDISAGLHHLRVSLANNDHSPVLPHAEDTVIIDVDLYNSVNIIQSSESDELADSEYDEP